MKKDINCMMGGFPGYGGMPPTGMMPTVPPMGGMPYPPATAPENGMYNGIEYQLNNLQNQVNMLEERVNKLEGKQIANNGNKYSDSNYYML